MNYEIDRLPLEEEGDGLPNMQWRLRVIVAATALGSAAAWSAVFFLI